jgi:hypothetical protein
MTRAYADAALLPVIEDNCPACFKVRDEGAGCLRGGGGGGERFWGNRLTNAMFCTV